MKTLSGRTPCPLANARGVPLRTGGAPEAWNDSDMYHIKWANLIRTHPLSPADIYNRKWVITYPDASPVPWQRREEFHSIPEADQEPGTTLIEVVVALPSWALAKASRGVGVVAPALAAVARNTCPFLTGGMR